MAYWITQFDTVSLGRAGLQHDVGRPQAHGDIVALPGGGAYDPYGTAQAPVALPYALEVRAEIFEDSDAALLAAWRALTALHGKRAKLYRTLDGGTENSQWVWARLVAIEAPRDTENVLRIPCALRFMVESAFWHGAAHSHKVVLDVSPKTIMLANNGNYPVNNALILVDNPSGASTITAIKVAVGGSSEWQWTGTLTAEDQLTVDCGAMSVVHGAVDAYAAFTLHATKHKINDWLRLEPGNTSVTVTRTGGSATSKVTFAYDDGWA